MSRSLWARIVLVYLGVQSILLGVWALLAPRSFYDDFPGSGRSWVAADGPYNEHLVRDVGALNLALLVLLAVAAVRLRRELVAVAAAASLVWGVPHLVYHALNTDGLSGGDIVASLGGLALYVVLPTSVLLRLPDAADAGATG
ncbi:MAG: hypothetical protein AAGD35_06520 [Actinomycetota bacterium]